MKGVEEAAIHSRVFLELVPDEGRQTVQRTPKETAETMRGCERRSHGQGHAQRQRCLF